jgi:multiple sugar transport system permease protein
MRETPGFVWFRRAGLTLLTVITVFPLYVVLVTSVKPLTEVQGTFEWVPRQITLSPYVDIWNTIPFAEYFTNSLIVAVPSTLISVGLATFAAYALARFRFRGARPFSLLVLSTQTIPGLLFLLPLFLLFVQIQTATGIPLTGSYLGLIVTYLTFSLPLSTWMLTGYFQSLPRELEEAAMVDGTGPVGALLRIVLPVARPGIIAVAVYCFILAWGEVLFASVLTTKDTRTLAVGLNAFAGESQVLWNQLMAASVVAAIPVVVGFISVQRYLIRGLAAGSVK